MFFDTHYDFCAVNKPRKVSHTPTTTRTCDVCQQPFRTIGETRHCSNRCANFAHTHFGTGYIGLLLYLWRQSCANTH